MGDEQSARFASRVAICAAIIRAVRLARDDINHPSPRVLCAVADSVTLAKMILKKVVGPLKGQCVNPFVRIRMGHIQHRLTKGGNLDRREEIGTDCRA